VFKIYKNVIFLLLLIIPTNANSHVQHYENLNRIEFDIYRNNTHIGKHVFSFKKIDGKFLVKSSINFKIKKFGITLYKYKAEGTEVFKNGTLIQFNSKTEQNGKSKYVNMELQNDKYNIDGSSYKGLAPTSYMLGTWWHHGIIEAKAQISPTSGRIIHQKVTFVGKEEVKTTEKIYKTLRFNFSSVDEKLSKGKRLNTDVWYDEKSLNWVKASFNKKGKWEYRLVLIN